MACPRRTGSCPAEQDVAAGKGEVRDMRGGRGNVGTCLIGQDPPFVKACSSTVAEGYGGFLQAMSPGKQHARRRAPL